MNDAAQKLQTMVWILGLHRSGTTVVWSAFRSNSEFLCYDEPLTEDLGNCFPRNNHKKTYDEYLRLFGGDTQKFWTLYNAINPLQELDATFTHEQKTYLTSLLQYGNNIVIDETHLHTHLPGINEITPAGHVIHLHRRARGYVTSHLRSTLDMNTTWSRRIVRLLRHEYDKKIFWNRYDFLPGLRRGCVIGSHPQSKFGLMLAEAGYDAERIMSAPTMVKLLAYWHYHYHYIEREGARLFRERFKSLRYEDFASHPDTTMADIYAWLGMASPAGVVYSDVHPPKPPFHPNDRRWTEAAIIAGFSNEELETLL
jgi:hypothetical protein